MARTPKRLHGPAFVTNSAATKYTVPALTKTIVRHIFVEDPTADGLSTTFTLSIGADASGVRIFDAKAMVPGQVIDFWCYFVLEVGEIIQAKAGNTNVLVLTIDGDEISLG